MHAADSARPPAHTVVVLGLLTMFGPLSLDLYLPTLPQLADHLNASTSTPRPQPRSSRSPPASSAWPLASR
ncbi:MAG TPA: hypothetical protein VFY56_14210 [Propionibacteriaceae bacterium]|nr:hypothetical protein [Propionibacteriaceae bacterium]